MVLLDGNFAVGCGPACNGLPLNTYISKYARTKRCYNERGSRTHYVRSSILHCVVCVCVCIIYIYIYIYIYKVNQSHYRPEVPRGFQEVKVPRLRDNGPG